MILCNAKVGRQEDYGIDDIKTISTKSERYPEIGHFTESSVATSLLHASFMRKKGQVTNFELSSVSSDEKHAVAKRILLLLTSNQCFLDFTSCLSRRLLYLRLVVKFADNSRISLYSRLKKCWQIYFLRGNKIYKGISPL